MAAVGYGTDREPESPPEPAGDATPGRWSTGVRLLVAAAAVVLVLGAAAVAVIVADPDRLGVTYSGAPDGTRADGTRPDGTRPDGTRPDGTRPDGTRVDGTRPDGTWPGDAGRPGGADPDSADGRPGAAGGELLTAPLAGRQKGTFVLADGLSSFELGVADLGDDLYRISSPAGSGVLGRPTVVGETVRLEVVKSGASETRSLRVALNERVAWRLQLVGGVSSQVLDLTRARLLGVELAGGSSRTEILLPPITATSTGNASDPSIMTVRLIGGTSQLDIRAAGETPVRVRVGAGAGSVAVRDDRWDGVAAGAVLSTPGWDRSAARLFLDLVAGANTVTVSANR
ncbi:hypothetical protein FBZ33_2566 [Micromonospora sp. A202]|uniref:hypothetical protein n=1 Tax=Micromonospora sp. A202 TaxID=2572899 RepID=UPI00114E9705|nr:hypothetical protein [Micromonospora sp. A202]TQJ22316.1 hypothetical protein FBZ33_2566 [Micromonospora sp. A202]